MSHKERASFFSGTSRNEVEIRSLIEKVYLLVRKPLREAFRLMFLQDFANLVELVGKSPTFSPDHLPERGERRNESR
jgi:hypothetical protein